METPTFYSLLWAKLLIVQWLNPISKTFCTLGVFQKDNRQALEVLSLKNQKILYFDVGSDFWLKSTD